MNDLSAVSPVQIGPLNKKSSSKETSGRESNGKESSPIALGSYVFGADQWSDEARANLLATMDAAVDAGINHFDTATGYGDGGSENFIGKFLTQARDDGRDGLGGREGKLFLASKAGIDTMDASLMHKCVDESLARLQTDFIDLYYIHWPRQGKDLRPLMEGLEQARAAGKIGAIGVSNFSVEQLEQVGTVGTVDAHQFCYNLFWRFAERDIIPYCQEKGIAVVTYSSIAQGVLTGKFPRHPKFEEGDSRAKTVHFEEDVWPHLYAGVERLKPLGQVANRPLAHLAIRWVLQQPGITTAVVGARSPEQVIKNAEALTGEIDQSIFDQMTEVGDEVMTHMPDVGNMYRYYP